MDAADVYRFRVEHFKRNFHSLRELESRKVVEVFTGYAVIGIAYFQLQDKYPGNDLCGSLALLLTLSLFTIALYVTMRSRERLQVLLNMQELYLKKLHEVCDAPELEPKQVRPPKHGYWWAFVAHIALSAIAMLALGTYIIGTTWGPNTP